MGNVLANSDLPEELRDFAAEGGTFGTAEVGDPPLEVDVMVALMLADPRHAARVLNPSLDFHHNHEDSSAVYALFGEASESLHKPLLLHRGATLEANIEAAATVLGRLRVLATQDIGYIMFQKGLSLKVRRYASCYFVLSLSCLFSFAYLRPYLLNFGFFKKLHAALLSPLLRLMG